MDHLSQNTPLHWGYSGTNASSTWAPVPRGVKRTLSDHDDDDLYSEGSSKDQCTSPGETDSCQMQSRKKRRGVIEKKRRDRINTSLLELKRLVPSAFEKQGSAKLEKAEILQLTVDHLKMIHAKGLDSYAYDQHKYAMDYHGMGYRECAAEVSRYLERIEGLDVQNPLRLRLTSHLQCCAAQRELSKQTPVVAPPVPPHPTVTGSWYGPSPTQAYPSLNPLPPSPASNHSHGLVPPPLPPTSMHDAPHFTDLSSACPPPTTSGDTRVTSASSVLTPLTSTTSMALAYPNHYSNSYGLANHHQQHYNQSGGGAQGMKPYRPWGAEVAY